MASWCLYVLSPDLARRLLPPFQIFGLSTGMAWHTQTLKSSMTGSLWSLIPGVGPTQWHLVINRFWLHDTCLFLAGFSTLRSLETLRFWSLSNVLHNDYHYQSVVTKFSLSLSLSLSLSFVKIIFFSPTSFLSPQYKHMVDLTLKSDYPSLCFSLCCVKIIRFF